MLIGKRIFLLVLCIASSLATIVMATSMSFTMPNEGSDIGLLIGLVVVSILTCTLFIKSLRL